MQTVKKTLENATLSYPLSDICPLEKALFLDIETTGFTAKNSVLYLIGCVYYENDAWHSIQWFADSYKAEKDVLESFLAFVQNYTWLIHFNGNHFDLPFIEQKCASYNLPCDFSAYKGIDIYQRIAPLKRFLGLENCKQKSIERFLKIDREDKYDGGQLISVYHDYVKDPKGGEALAALLCHNADDIAGMLALMPILAYADLFSNEIKVKKVQANYFHDVSGEEKSELYMKLRFSTPLPQKISVSKDGCYFSGEGLDGALKVPLYEEEMKYFYSDYKDYYYLPIEDVAMHKSIASFVDKSHRRQAKASDCYTRKKAVFLPQWEVLYEPFFKRDYNSKEYFFELTDEMKKDRILFNSYATHVLQMMLATIS